MLTLAEHALIRKDFLEIWSSKMARATLIAVPIGLVVVVPALFLAAVMVLLNIGASLAGTAMLQPIIDNFLEPVAEIPLAARFTGLFQGVITLLCIYLLTICRSSRCAIMIPIPTAR